MRRFPKIRSCFSRADISKFTNCVSASASVFAEAWGFAYKLRPHKTPRQVRLRSPSYDGTRQPNILKHSSEQTTHTQIIKAGFAVKINFLGRERIFRPIRIYGLWGNSFF